MRVLRLKIIVQQSGDHPAQRVQRTFELHPNHRAFPGPVSYTHLDVYKRQDMYFIVELIDRNILPGREPVVAMHHDHARLDHHSLKSKPVEQRQGWTYEGRIHGSRRHLTQLFVPLELLSLIHI